MAEKIIRILVIYLHTKTIGAHMVMTTPRLRGTARKKKLYVTICQRATFWGIKQNGESSKRGLEPTFFLSNGFFILSNGFRTLSVSFKTIGVYVSSCIEAHLEVHV